MYLTPMFYGFNYIVIYLISDMENLDKLTNLNTTI